MGCNEAYAKAAYILGKELLKRGIGLVYGDGNIGLMGQIVRTVYEGGGEV